MILRPKDFFDLRFELIKDYPGCPFREGDIIDAGEFEGEVYIKPSDSFKIQPLKFPSNFRKLRWWEHRTIEQFLSISYVKIISGSNYYVQGDIVKVTSVHYNDASLVGGRNNILFNLNGHNFIVSQLEPAHKQEYEKFKAQ